MLFGMRVSETDAIKILEVNYYFDNNNIRNKMSHRSFEHDLFDALVMMSWICILIFMKITCRRAINSSDPFFKKNLAINCAQIFALVLDGLSYSFNFKYL